MTRLSAIALGGECGEPTDTALFKLAEGQSLNDGQAVSFYDWRCKTDRTAVVTIGEDWTRGRFVHLLAA